MIRSPVSPLERQRAFDDLGDIVARDLDRREIDANVDRQRLAGILVPSGESPHCLVHRPAAELEDEPAFLGDRNEFGRADLAAILVVPARQRLEAGYLAGLQVDERLIEELQLVLVERAAKLGLDREATPGLGRLLGLIDLRLAGELGLLDRKLRVAEQFFGILSGMHQRHADRAFDANLEV